MITSILDLLTSTLMLLRRKLSRSVRRMVMQTDCEPLNLAVSGGNRGRDNKSKVFATVKIAPALLKNGRVIINGAPVDDGSTP